MKFALRALLLLCCGAMVACAQSVAGKTPATKADTTTASELERKFFTIVRDGDALQFLGFVPEDGINLGRDPQHATRSEIEEQLTHHAGLYCKLFDSSCLPPTGKTDSTAKSCSYRELLTQSEKVRTASTETTRNGVRQAILVAEVHSQNCSGPALIDFIFNHQHNGWKLFSIP